MASGRSFFGSLASIARPLKKTVRPLTGGRTEREIMAAVIERIPLRESPEPPTETSIDEEYQSIVRRLRIKIDEAEITTDELIRGYDRPLEAILLFKYVERAKNKESTAMKERLGTLGFKYLQNGVWILPPAKLSQRLGNGDDLKLWVYQNLVRPAGKDLQYVLPVVSVIDLKKTIGERRRILKKPLSKTVFTVMDMEEIFPPKYIYEYMKRKGMSPEEIVKGGDFVFLASAFADEETMGVLVASKARLVEKVQGIMGTHSLSLAYLAALNETDLAAVLVGTVPHPKDFSQRLIVEARYWQRFFEGGNGTAEEPPNSA